MKHLSFIFGFVLVLAVMAGTAQAKISGFFAQVGSRDTPEAAFVDDVPAGFTAWQLFIKVEDTTDDGKPNGFIAGQLQVNLTDGEIYYDFIPGFPVQSNSAHLTPGVGANSEAIFRSLPSARFDTHITAPGNFPNPFLGSEDTEITNPDGSMSTIPGLDAYPPNGSTLDDGFVARRGALLTPTAFGSALNMGSSTRFFNAGYFDIPDTNPDSDLFNPFFTDGTYVIAMVTLSDDADGTIRLLLNDENNKGTSPPLQIFEVVDGVIPEPSSVVLALLGLVGLGMTRLRRRCRA